jgi:putative ribosome biogenesis GTPase RsgA
VRNALNAGKINKIRYNNYVTLYEELKESEKRKY